VSGERGRAGSVAQYVLLGGFASVASGISSQGLTGFARANMGLSGPWPYLLFLSLDGAAGVCAVLLARRAVRGGGSLAPRIAVWGLVGASAAFNFTHAPRRPDAPEAYAMMPVIAAVLFGFCLQETRSRAAVQADRRLGPLRWLRPAERARVGLRMAANDALCASEATRRVRVESAARSLYRLRQALAAQGLGTSVAASRQARRALRRAHAALAQAGFADAAVAAEVLRHVQVLTMTTTLATLDYASARAAHAALATLITPATTPAPSQQGLTSPQPERARTDEQQDPSPATASPEAGQVPQPAAENKPAPLPPPAAAFPADATTADGDGTPLPDSAAGRDRELIEAARRIAASAACDGSRLSQAALAEKLRSEGWTIANDRLSWLAATIGLSPRRG
jgi:hypothetical protein